jgi:tetratricopeptide (TPR) repeat protein
LSQAKRRQWDDSEIEQLINSGKLSEALNAIELLENRDDLDDAKQLKIKLLRTRIQKKRGYLQESIRLAEDILTNHQQQCSPLQALDACITAVDALDGLKKYDECLKMIEYGEKLVKTFRTFSFTESEYSGIMKRETELKYCRGRYYLRKRAWEQALGYYEESLALSKKIDSKLDNARALRGVGHVHAMKGDRKGALEYYSKSLAISDEIAHKESQAYSLRDLALTFFHIGEFNRALKYNHRSLKLFEEVGNISSVSLVLGNISEILLQKGDLDRALQYIQKSLALDEQLESASLIARHLGVHALIYTQKGAWDQAWDYGRKSYDFYKAGNKILGLSYVLIHMVALATYLGQQDLAQQYLEELKQLNASETNKFISLRYRLAKALVLKKSGRSRDRGKAEDLLQQIVEEEIFEHEMTVLALLMLCELLLEELRAYGDLARIADVSVYVDRLLKIAKHQQSYWLFIKIYVLKSKLALLDLDLKSARRLLTQAQLLAEDKGLKRLAKEISSDYDKFLQQYPQWEELRARKAALVERLELAQVEELVTLIAQRRVVELPDQPPEEPVMLFILSRGGVTLFSQMFHSSSPVHEQLIGGFLTAVNNVGTEILDGTETLDRIMYREHTIAVKAVDPLMFCYVFKGSSYGALYKLQCFIDSVQGATDVWASLRRTARKGFALPTQEEASLESLITKTFPTVSPPV